MKKVLFLSALAVVAGLVWRSGVLDGSGRRVARLSARYGIPIEVPDDAVSVRSRHGTIACRSAARAERAADLPLFVEEFGRYPPELLRKGGVTRVVVCARLEFAGARRGAIPDLETGTFYLDAAREAHELEYARRILHHDLFHLVDWKDDSSLEDKEWEGLNAAGFGYGRGGALAQQNEFGSELTAEHPGFLTVYAMSAVEEDKAELYSNLLVEPTAAAKLVAADPLLARKAARLGAELGAFCPEACSGFWPCSERERRALRWPRWLRVFAG